MACLLCLLVCRSICRGCMHHVRSHWGLGTLCAGSADQDDSASQASEDTPARRSEREQIKRDLLMGHLLSLATQSSPSGLPAHALPALAASLSGKGLMPKWVQWSLTQQPALFNKAFERLFSEVPTCQTVSQCQLSFRKAFQ